MGRSPCCEKAHTNKGAWTNEEDQKLISYIRAHSEGCWRSLPKAAGLLRCGKSCRLRWINYLWPDLKRCKFTEEEDELIIELYGLLGNKVSLIAGRLPGRTDNDIKNYWNMHIKRKLLSWGIDRQRHGSASGNAAPRRQEITTMAQDMTLRKPQSTAATRPAAAAAPAKTTTAALTSISGLSMSLSPAGTPSPNFRCFGNRAGTSSCAQPLSAATSVSKAVKLGGYPATKNPHLPRANAS
ncbi:unnamed protein product [Musa textilis]